jgi:protein involved in polysaccharide export with SLBB domain
MPKLRSLPVAGLLCLAIVGSGRAVAQTAAAAPPSTVGATPLADVSGPYRLGLGDKLRIQVFGEPDLSGEFQVSGSGTVNMPLIGDVKAVGLTAQDLQDQLTNEYRAGYVKDPKIAVEVYDFRPFFILGEVEKPGRYPATEGATALSAIATAGGFTYRADTKRLFIRRAGDTAERRVDVSANVAIQPGDVIRVGERHF